MAKNIVIIGAGMAGCIAYGALRGRGPKVYDARSKRAIPIHQAVMRLRDPGVAVYLGVGAEKISVTKEIFLDNRVMASPNIRANNLYSLKLYGQLGQRSLGQSGVVERFLLESWGPPASTKYKRLLVGIKQEGKKRWLVFRSPDLPSPSTIVPYDYCISTIPLPIMAKIVGYEDLDFPHMPIYVLRYKITGLKSTVHQTIYVPEPTFWTYRATLEGQDVIFESTEEFVGDQSKPSGGSEAMKLLRLFGLDGSIVERNLEFVGQFKQQFGKIQEINDTERKALILDFTDRLGIFSFGRFAIWKPIRSDHLVKDIEQIQRLINIDKERRRYESRLANIHPRR